MEYFIHSLIASIFIGYNPLYFVKEKENLKQTEWTEI